jgi:hypothetical protein
MARNTKPRELVWVHGFASMPTLKYGFNSGADAADKGILGQSPVNPNELTGLVIGANNIKPPKATKVKATGSESSFCGHDKVAALKAAGWTVTRGKIKSRASSKRSTVYYVTINGIKYAWSAAKTTLQGVDAKSLGLKTGKPTDGDLIFGCSFPKPGRASIKIGASTYSTFYDPSATPAEGWSTSSPKLTLA